MKLTGLRFIFTLLALIVSVSLLAEEKPFDEIYGVDEREKNVRTPYREIVSVYKGLSKKEKQSAIEKGKVDFMGDNALLPLPKVYSDVESEVISQGVKQRVRAIQAFLNDHYSQDKRYLSEEVIPLPVIQRIFNRSSEYLWEEFYKDGELNFWYGPDVIRGPQTRNFPEGQFFVVEDNPGYIGGMGDLIMARKSLMKNVPGYKGVIDSPKPKKFYDKLAHEYKKRAKAFNGVPVLIQYIREISADNEDVRIHDIFEKRGIKVVQIDPFDPDESANRKLVADKDGVWLWDRASKDDPYAKSKVGYVIGNMDSFDLDPDHKAGHPKRVIEEALDHLEEDLPKKIRTAFEQLLKPGKDGRINIQKLEKFIREESPYADDLDKKVGVPGLIDHFIQKNIGLTNPPGIEFIGDKEFYIYIDKLIKFYLNEKPIIKNIETGSFAKYNKKGKLVVNKKELKRILNNLDDFVIKGVDGRGGDAVWVGPKIKGDKDLIEKVTRMIEKNPARYIFQSYTALSTMGDYIGDSRFITDVGTSKITVAKVPWARVVSKSGDGKVNISANGFEATVLINRTTSPNEMKKCLKRLRKVTNAK
jgi:uncharacterized circularly permuted ATP-grasp superfamily protein